MTNEEGRFHAIDYDREIEIRARYLPHWYQAGTVVFITFRTADSLPKSVVSLMRLKLEDWLQRNGVVLERPISNFWSTSVTKNPSLATLSAECRSEYSRQVRQLYHWAIDQCHGHCLLRQQRYAQIVAESILFHDGTKYDLDRFVIMPNHVHVLAQFKQEDSFNVVGQSWLRYSARKINEAAGLSGALWMPEVFDHLVRSSAQFEWLRRYIEDNPSQAKLRNGEFLYWVRDDS